MRDEKPVARLVPYVQELPKRGFGSMRGKAWLDDELLGAATGRGAEALGGWLELRQPVGLRAENERAPTRNQGHATLSGL